VRRREFVAGLGLVAVWPRAVRAQRSAKLPVIGLLGASTAETAGPWIAAFVRRLGELGWTDGKNVMIEYRWADGRGERYGEIATELANRNVDVIVTWASAPVLAAKRATTTIPIVFAAQMDPVGVGVVASLGRPGGNITGMSIQQTDTAGKRIELLREAVPRLSRLAVMTNTGAPGAVLEMHEVVASAHGLGLEATPIEVKQADDIFASIESLKDRADALYVATDPLIFNNRLKLNAMAHAASADHLCWARISRCRSVDVLRSVLDRSVPPCGRAGRQGLRGTRPADIPVEQPTKFYLVINAKTAKAIGLDLSPSLLARADEVIE
jgi:putative ABC transport system substrate-binding protein